MSDRATAPTPSSNDLRRRALDARMERDRTATEAAELGRREHRARALDDLHEELVALLGICMDDAEATVEWSDDLPIAVIQGMRFRIEDGYGCGPYRHLRAAVAREGCGHEVGGIIGLHGRATAWADLGDLIARTEESFRHPCRRCVEDAADSQKDGGELAPLPPILAVGERLEQLVREIVREEVCG